LPTVVSESDRRELEQLDEAIDRWSKGVHEAIAEHPETLDREHVRRWAETARRWALRLHSSPPPVLSPAALAEIRGIIIDGIEAVDRMDQPLDLLDDLIIRAEAVRHILRDVLDGDVGVNEDDAGALIRRLEEWLPGVGQKAIAQLVGRSQRHIQRWLKEGGVATPRLRLVAQLVALLHRGWSPEGVLSWFSRPRRDLAGERPIDVLEDPFFEHDLLQAAREGRAQHRS